MYKNLWRLITFTILLWLYFAQSYADMPKPDHFGVFLVDGGKLRELKVQEVVQKNLVGYMTIGLIGLKEVNESVIVSDSAYFIIYGQPQPPTQWRISCLKYVDRFQDVMIRKDPFRVDMWLPDTAVQFTISIIENMPNAFILKPLAPLAKGGYVLHFHNLEPLTYVGKTDAQVYPIAVGGALEKAVEKASIEGVTIYAIHFSIRNPKLYFLGSTGCIYKKLAEEYVRIPIRQTKDNISLLVVNPNDTQELFVSFASMRNKKFLLFSNSGGMTWEETELMGLRVQDWAGCSYTLHFNAVKFDVNDPDRIVIAATGVPAGEVGEGKGVFVASLDGGITWPEVKIQDKVVYDAVSKGNSAFFSTDKAVYRFLLNSQKSEKIDGSPARVKYLRISPTADKAIIAVTLLGGIYISIDNGRNFTLLSNLNKNVQDFVIDPKLATTLWLATEEELYKTTDNGMNWSNVIIDGLNWGQIFCLAINPESGNEVYVGTSQGLFITKDGGVNWVKEK